MKPFTTLYEIQSGDMSYSYTTTSPSKAFQEMLKWFKASVRDCAILVRFRFIRPNGKWTRWQYQDPVALMKEP